MTIRPIILANQPLLRKKAYPVKTVDDSIRRLLDDMLETMYYAKGLGLAAPQIGIAKRVIVVDCCWENDKPRTPVKLVNPQIVFKSHDIEIKEEGCLSIPEQYGNVPRSIAIEVQYLDENNENRTLHAQDLLARCIQHEVDHLNGVLFMDYLSRQNSRAIMRAIKKYPN